MPTGGLAQMRGAGGTVEVDETLIGIGQGAVKRRGYTHKSAVLSPVDCDTKQVWFLLRNGIGAADLIPILRAHLAEKTAFMTNETGQYQKLDQHFARHNNISHVAGEYENLEDRTTHTVTITIEGYCSILKTA